MNYILLCVSLICGVGKNLTSKAGGERFAGISNLMNINIITAVTALVIFGFSLTNIQVVFSAKFMTFSVLYGALSMLSSVLYIIGVRKGNVAVCSLIYACGFLIPTIFTSVYFNENMPKTCLAGIVILMLSVLMVTGRPKAGGGKKYLIPAFAAMLCSGGVGVLQRLFNHAYEKLYINEFLFASFFCMLLAATAFKLVSKGSERASEKKADPKYFAYAVPLSVFTAVANKLNLYLSGVMRGVVFFPVVNGGCIALTALMSEILLKEKLTKTQRAGIGISVLAIVLIFV